MANISLKRAVVITVTTKYAAVIINLLFMMLLARILTPSEYGIVAAVMVFSTFFSLLADMGVGIAVIQNKELTVIDINNIFSLTVYVGILFAIFFALFSYPVSSFYGNSIYFPIGCILSFSLMFNAFNIVPNALLMREKRFATVGVRTVIAAIINGIITWIMAMRGVGAYSIVLGAVLSALFLSVTNILKTDVKFSFYIQKNSIKKIASFSGFLLAFNIINYFSQNLDNLLLGKYFGPAALGYYDKAFRLMKYPVNSLTHAITPALHPIFSDYQDNKKNIYDKYIHILKFLAVCGLIVSAFCYLSAQEIIRLLFGSNWDMAIPCFRWFSLSIWTQITTSSVGAIFESLNDTKGMFTGGLVSSFLFIVAVIDGICAGNIERVSMSISLAYFLSFFINYYILIKKSFSFSYINFLMTFCQDVCLGLSLLIGVVIYPFDINQIFISATAKLIYILIISLITLQITGEWNFIKKSVVKK